MTSQLADKIKASYIRSLTWEFWSFVKPSINLDGMLFAIPVIFLSALAYLLSSISLHSAGS